MVSLCAFWPGNAFWCILKATERSFVCIAYYADALSSSNSVSGYIFWGGKAEILEVNCPLPRPNVERPLG